MEAILTPILFLMELMFKAFLYLLFLGFNWIAEGVKHPSPSAVLVRLGIVASVLIFLTMLGGVLQWWHADHTRRVAATEQTVDRLAEEYYQQSKADDAQFQDGPLTELDAWDQPLQLDTEKSLLGWWIVVRSNGPDGRPGTEDDVEAIRQNWSNLEQVGGELAQRGTDKVKEKIKGLFVGKPDEQEDAAMEQAAVIAPQDEEEGNAEVEAEDPNKKAWKFDLKFGFGKED